MNWNLLETKAVIDEKARVLRCKCRGHYYSNYNVFSATLEKEFSYTKIWIAEEGDNMLLLQKYNNFYKLFYFIGEVESLHLSFPEETKNAKILCELFDEDDREKQTPALLSLKQNGFSVYRKFYMWESTENNGLICDDPDIEFKDGITKNQLQDLFDYFDPLVDLIPLTNQVEDYYNSKHFLACYVKGKYVGCAVYSVKDAQVDEDFIYILPMFRGVGKYLYSALLNVTFNTLSRKKLIPWIHTENERSISFHSAAGARRTPYYKISLLLTNNK